MKPAQKRAFVSLPAASPVRSGWARAIEADVLARAPCGAKSVILNMNAILPVSREPALARLRALAELDPHEMAMLDQASQNGKYFGAGSEIMAEGKPIADARILLSGWA